MGYLPDVQDGNWGLVTQLTHPQGMCEQQENIPSQLPTSLGHISPTAGEYMQLCDSKKFLQPQNRKILSTHGLFSQRFLIILRHNLKITSSEKPFFIW